ncbi:MAG: N-6 DNA methylase, partial [Bacteroidetes bacterium]|nr:N-6 DNA methylase [Bacteroidota bacterium]
ETSIRTAFVHLINEYAQKRNLYLITELAVKGTLGKAVYPDGILKNALRLDFGYWESKDESDDINEEISKKTKKGYPLTNILFEDSQTAVLYQNGQETMRVNMKNADALDRILNAFTGFVHPEILRFEEAVEKFKADIPDILRTLREKVDEASRINPAFVAARDTFLELCRAEINPDITPEDVREMMNQHILTADIFNVIFDDPHFHHENNIGRELERLIGTFFTGSERRNILAGISHYYKTLNAAAANIADHHEKQKFLKAIYENFYKVYNPKAADRLGVVYTPGEIVHFMIQSTDYLLHKHFNRTLADANVDILDPATGTGTFICDLIEYLPKAALPQKYKTEIHANEIAILPYYIANLNIEYTYKQKMNEYVEFKNICFVDTLDNTAGLVYAGKQGALFGFSSENSERIQRQNERKISVIIGNPPYNANQQNENENNKNREYAYIDKRIKDTFIKYSTAQKTKVYDMYARFYRWAMDRLDNNGIIAFITNRSFIDSRTFDGFRKCVEEEFDYVYIVDTHSDVRANPKIAGTSHNVFGIQTGVAVMFLVKIGEK